jgi:hypothetical protein
MLFTKNLLVEILSYSDTCHTLKLNHAIPSTSVVWVFSLHNCLFRCAYSYTVMFMATLFSDYSQCLNRTVHLHTNAITLICTALGGVNIKPGWMSFSFIHLMICVKGVATNHQKGGDWKCIQSQGVWEDDHLAPRFGFDGLWQPSPVSDVYNECEQEVRWTGDLSRQDNCWWWALKRARNCLSQKG